MPWVSNHTDASISISITNNSGGENATFTVPPAILYNTIAPTAPEISDKNYWWRNHEETITVTTVAAKHSFTVQANDHVIIYTDSYETHPVTFGWLKP